MTHLSLLATFIRFLLDSAFVSTCAAHNGICVFEVLSLILINKSFLYESYILTVPFKSTNIPGDVQFLQQITTNDIYRQHSLILNQISFL